jgi:hypothetical protein
MPSCKLAFSDFGMQGIDRFVLCAYLNFLNIEHIFKLSVFKLV